MTSSIAFGIVSHTWQTKKSCEGAFYIALCVFVDDIDEDVDPDPMDDPEAVDKSGKFFIWQHHALL